MFDSYAAHHPTFRGPFVEYVERLFVCRREIVYRGHGFKSRWGRHFICAPTTRKGHSS